MSNPYATTAGTQIFYDDVGTGDPSTALAGIDEINGLPVHEVDEIETTRIDQKDSGSHDWWKQFVPDHIDPGSMELSLSMEGAKVETLYTLIRQMKAWKILFSSGDKVVFDGYLSRLGHEATKGDEVVVPVTIRCSGKPTFTKFTPA